MAHCQVSWDSYRNNICNGFSDLQQSEQFVDMTLAAEGHLVKVHKTLIALASPYLREMIQSAPCQHPVIFLNRISQEILSYILEYIYMGQVKVPVDVMTEFIQAAKALHIIGVSGLIPAIPVAVSRSSKEKRVNKDTDIQSSQNSKSENEAFENDEPLEIKSIDHISPYIPTTGSNVDVVPKTDLVAHEQQPVDVSNSHPIVNLDDSPTVSEIEGDDDNGLFIPNIEKETVNQTMQIDVNELPVIIAAREQYESRDLQEPAEHVSNATCGGTLNIFNVKEGHPTETDFDQLILDAMGDQTKTNLQPKDTKENTNAKFSIVLDHPQPIVTLKNPVPVQKSIQANEIIIQPLASRGDLVEFNKMQILGDGTNVPMDVDAETSKNYSIAVELPKGDQDAPQISITASSIVRGPVSTSNTDNLPLGTAPLYMVTGRGAMQMILNRCIYYTHHSSRDGHKKRWRCIDYRHKNCKAFVDTEGDLIVRRKFCHVHTFHDEKIMKRGMIKNVFSSIEELQLHLQACKRSNSNDTTVQ